MVIRSIPSKVEKWELMPPNQKQSNALNKLNTSRTAKVKQILKELFTTRFGWFSILLANVIWSMFWIPFVVLWFITGDNQYLIIASGIYLFFAQPLIPMWLIIPLTAYFILKKVLHR